MMSNFPSELFQSPRNKVIVQPKGPVLADSLKGIRNFPLAKVGQTFWEQDGNRRGMANTSTPARNQAFNLLPGRYSRFRSAPILCGKL